jgi:dipeptidyl-peptidase 4
VINYAEGLRGDLLIISGSGSSVTNTHIKITEGLANRLIALGKCFNYFVYPNRDHCLSEGEGKRVHVQTLVSRYLIVNLPAGPK